MNIPLNGRIAIVDDKYAEVKPLINAFSKKRIPFNYYTGLKKADLPDNPDKNPVTLIFLDLNIIETQHNVKVVISTLNPILKALCPGKSKPYFLVIWSKKINDFADALEKHFKRNPDLKGRRPVKFIRLDKSDYFYLGEDGKYLFDEDKYDELVATLKSELENLSLLKSFMSWENIVHHQATETIGEFSSFFDINDNWDKNTKAIVYHLAKAIIGNDNIQTASDEAKLAIAFSTINSFLSDKIHYASLGKRLGDISDLIDDSYDFKKNKDGRLKKGIRSKINTKLHIADNIQADSFEQGNVYRIKNEYNLIRRILDREKYNNEKASDIFKSRPSLIQLDLTPACDYSQDKKYVRMVYGLLIDARFAGINIMSAYQRQTPTFHISGKEKFMVFDYRFITTTTKEEIGKKKMKPLLRLRREICTDIQSQLSNQINRPGISNV